MEPDPYISEEEIRAAESVWQMVLSLIKSGVPIDGIASIARSTLRGLAEVREKMREPKG